MDGIGLSGRWSCAEVHGRDREWKETANGNTSNLEKTVQAAVEEFFDSDAEKAMYVREGTATYSNVSLMPHRLMYMRIASPSDYRRRMTSGLSLGTDPRLLGRRCSSYP